MLKSVKSSFKETLIYSFGNIAVKIVGLILIPLYTDPKYFSIDDFGILGILEICGLVLTAFMASALPQSLVRWYWDKEFQHNQKGIFFMTLATQIVVSLAFCLSLIPLSGNFSEMIFPGVESISSDNLDKILSLVIIASAFQSINNIQNTLMRLQTRSVLYSVTNLLRLIVVLSLTLYLVISKEMKLEGIYLAQVAGNAFITVLLSGYSFRNSALFFDLKIFRSMSQYGFPLLLANISAVTLTVIDRFSLNSLSVYKSLGLYTLAFKLTSVLKLVVVDSMRLAIGPMMIKRMYSPDNKRFYSKILLYTSYVLMFSIVGLSAFSFEAIKILANSKEFWGSVTIIPILSLSIFFINMKDITVYGLHIAKKTRVIGTVVVASAVLSLILNILLIPKWDITGSAIATLITQLFYWLAIYYFSQKAFPVPYETGKIFIIILVGMILSFGSQFLNGIEIIPRLLLKTVLVISYPFIFLLFGFYEHEEIQAIRGFFRKWLQFNKLGENIKSLKKIRDEL